jgi:hypothetical protein
MTAAHTDEQIDDLLDTLSWLAAGPTGTPMLRAVTP